MIKTLFSEIKSWFREAFTKKNTDFLRIISVEGCPEQKNTEIYYQVRGKSTVSRDTPQKLIDDLALLTGFSKNESNLILNLFISQHVAPRWKINNITYDEQGAKLHILDVEERKMLHFSPEMLLECDSLLEYFGRRDLVVILKLARSHLSQKYEGWVPTNTNPSKKNLFYVVKK